MASIVQPTTRLQQSEFRDSFSPAAAAKRDGRAFKRAWLTVRVHADAFRLAPLLYLQGVMWRLRRLKVRSRHRITALAGRSPHAYALWIERYEEHADGRTATAHNLLIQPVIDCRHGTEGLERSLNSIARAGSSVDPLLIGSGFSGRAIAKVSDLSSGIRRYPAWLLPLRPGDELAVGAIATYAEAAARANGTGLVFADDDLIGPDGRRHTPHFKPDWNPELFKHHDFLTGACVVRFDAERVATLPEDGWAEALVRGSVQQGGQPVHVRQVLHHRRSRPRPVVPAKPASMALSPAPTVTAIVPTRDRHELLRTCLAGLAAAAYPGMETIVVDNGSTDLPTVDYLSELESSGVTVLRIPGPFNYSALNNAAVPHASGDFLCFLNNDVEMTDPDWLWLLVEHAAKPDIGAVGARLLYPDGTIQHAGVFTGIGGGAGHAHRFVGGEEEGYFHRARLPQRVSAVTGACMVVAREKFLAVGGFDEERFPVAFNDVDLCLKLNQAGWQSFYEPRSTLIHHESKSRGSDRLRINRARFAGELAALKAVWHTDQFRDPYHHPHLSPFCEQFFVGV